MTHASAPDNRARQRAREYEARWAAFLVAGRGIPSQLKARCPHLTPGDEAVLDGLVVEALGELAQRVGPVHPNLFPPDQEDTTP
jgi:hypothetical protein